MLVVVVCRLFGDEVIPAICPLEVSVVVFIVATSMKFELAIVCIVVIGIKDDADEQADAVEGVVALSDSDEEEEERGEEDDHGDEGWNQPAWSNQ